jgi:hypothetical protein
MGALQDLVDELTGDGDLSAEDALAIRRRIWPDGVVRADEAELLFALNDAVVTASPEWVDCFVEAMVVCVVDQASPRGYVDEDRAAWLIERVRRDGRVGTLAELETLVRVVENAVSVPATLKAFVLDEIERLVLTGLGPTRDGGSFEPGVITAAEAALLRRVLFASGGDGPASVSAAEAEMLFRLKDASLDKPNAPEWERLFVQGVANFLQAYSGYRPLSRTDAARLEGFMEDREVCLGRFLRRMAGSLLRPGAAKARANRRDHDEAVAAANAITPIESVWLDQQVNADGRIDPLERALLDFLRDERR